jgi:hypothetical protein
MATHAKLSASGSSTWLNCPASIKATANVENKSSAYAQEGTFAHAMSELCLNTGNNASYYLTNAIPRTVYDETSNDFIYDLEMADNVQIYLDFVRSFNLPFKVEVRCDYSQWVPEGFGTSDCLAFDNTTNTLHVIDLKYGKGVKVYSTNNTQAQLYALGSLSQYQQTPNEIHIHIVQPRLDHIDTTVITYDELMTFADYATKQAQLALSDNPPFNPSEKACKWCNAKSTCKALAKYSSDTVLTQFDVIDEPEMPVINTLSHEQMKRILDNKSLIEYFLKAVESHAFDILTSGKEFEGYKLVQGRSVSKWLDDAESTLLSYIDENKLYKKSLITITEAKKLISKDLITELTYKPEGKPTLAKSCDKRKSIDMLNFF